MSVKVNRSYLAALVLLFLVGISWKVFAGPRGIGETKPESSSSATSESSLKLSGQELWSMNCQRCHNMRSPVMYTNTQWQVIVHHMRIRANITGEDARAIADFLKSGSP